MKLKRIIESMSFNNLVGISLIITIVLMIPITVTLVEQQTKITGRAYFEKPNPVTPTPFEYGNPSLGQPQISLVWPFLGKPGDAVLLYGENLGDNPKEKSLILGSQVINEKDIISWTPTLVKFQIPSDSKVGVFEPLELSVANQISVWEHPFVIYSVNTKVQISKSNNHIEIFNNPNDGIITIDFNDGDQMEVNAENSIPLPAGKTIVSIKLTDKNGLPIPFFVEPTEFGF